jgi:flagellar protein FliJ
MYPKQEAGPMARFRYRLQKVFEMRERKKKEQEEAVGRAMARVRQVEEEIQRVKGEIRTLDENRRKAHHTMFEMYTNYIYTQYNELEVQYQNLAQAKEDLEWEKQLLLKAHAELEALIKHKEKSFEMWLEEEKFKEMKMLDEVAGQRYFRQTQEKLEEERLDQEVLDAEALAEEQEQAILKAFLEEEQQV